MMGSTHHLTKAKILPKFNENLSNGKRDMKRIVNSRLNLMTFNCDLGSVVVVVVLLFYVHGKHLRSCRDGLLT